MTSAHHDTCGAEHQDQTDRDGWSLDLAELGLVLVAGLIIGFGFGRFG